MINWILITVLIIVIIWIIWKIVVAVTKVLTVASDKAEYTAGEVAVISGKLTGDGLPIADATVNGAVVFPGGTQSQDFTAVTDASGNYSYSFDTTGKAQGIYTVQVSAVGEQASTTFQQIIQIGVSCFDCVECRLC